MNCQCSGKDQRETAALEASKNLPPSATYSQFGAEESNDSEDSLSLDSDVCEWLDSLVIREDRAQDKRSSKEIAADLDIAIYFDDLLSKEDEPEQARGEKEKGKRRNASQM